MARYDYALFDFDGTLYNTRAGVVGTYDTILNRLYGDRYDGFNLDLCIGPPLADSFSKIIGIPAEDVDKAVAMFRAEYEATGMYNCGAYDGMMDAVRRLRDGGVSVGIASSKTESIIVRNLTHDGYLELFDCVSGMAHDGDLSTKAMMINAALDRLGISDRSRVVMVGDRYYDAEGAEKTGVDFIAALYGFGQKEEFKAYPTVFFADSPKETADYILSE